MTLYFHSVAKNLLQGCCHRLWATNTKTKKRCSVNLLQWYQIKVEFKPAYIFNPILQHLSYASHRDGLTKRTYRNCTMTEQCKFQLISRSNMHTSNATSRKLSEADEDITVVWCHDASHFFIVKTIIQISKDLLAQLLMTYEVIKPVCIINPEDHQQSQ